jgi:hypothetical protein
MLIPARNDFKLCRFFSMRLSTELTKPAPWPFAVVGETRMSAAKMKTAIKPRGINLFIITPLIISPFPGPKKPSNYREELTYVNLEAPRGTVGGDHPSNPDYLYFVTPGQGLNSIGYLPCITFIYNNFRCQQDCGNSALMPTPQGPFAVFEPTFGCQKDKYQN